MVFAAAAASASPGNAAAGGRYRQHPPYKEMILNAIGTLKERGGSSRRAISKFIGDTYSDLPPTHSALLGHHLRRLKNKGVLRMVKNSYKLSVTVNPVDQNASPAPAPRPRGRPPKKLPAPPPKLKPKSKPKAASTPAKRKPGRPPKVPKVASPTAGEKKKRGRPPKSAKASVLAKRSKVDKAPASAAPAAPAGKRKPGRPRKNPTGAAAVPNDNAAPSGGQQKRGRGRPRKARAPPLPKPAKQSREKAAMGDESAVPVVKRRGRPPKKSIVAAAEDQGTGQAATVETQESAPEV